MTRDDGRERLVTDDHRFDVAPTLSLMVRGRGDPASRRDGPVLWRASRVPSGVVTYAITQVSPTSARVRAWGAGAEELLESAPAVLGLEDDPRGFVPGPHPVLADAHRRFPGLRVPRSGRVTEALMAAIIEQKVVGRDAFASWRRLLLRFGTPAPGPFGDALRVPPTAAEWAAIPGWEWHRAGVDPRRAAAAQAAARRADHVETLAARTPHDPAPVYAALLDVRGVGVWTAAEVGARALGDADAVSFGDYHLGRLVGLGLSDQRDLTDHEVAELLEPWRGHRGRVVRLLTLSPLHRPERRGPRMPRVDHRAI